MNTHNITWFIFRRVLLYAILCAYFITDSAQKLYSRTLVENSPFSPAQIEDPSNRQTPQKPEPTLKRFQLAGVAKWRGTYYFSIHDSQSGKAEWIREGESFNGFYVTSYDIEAFTVSFKWRGKTGTSSLAEVNRSSSLAAANFHPAKTQSSSPTPTPSRGSRPASQPAEKRLQVADSPARPTAQSVDRVIEFEVLASRKFISIGGAPWAISTPTFALNDTEIASKGNLQVSDNISEPFILRRLSGKRGSVRVNRVNNPKGKPPKFN